MSDEVEIIENCPEIIVISDESDEDCNDFIEINYDSEDLENYNNKNGVIAIKNETSESTDLLGNTTAIQNHNAICEVAGVGTNKNNTTNTSLTNTSNIKIGNSRRKRRKRRKRNRRRLANAANRANQAFDTTNRLNAIYNIVARSRGASNPEHSENSSQIIKWKIVTNTKISKTDKEPAQNIANSSGVVNNASQNTSGSRTVPCRKHFDYSKLKWLTPLHNHSSPPHLQLVIIDRSHPDWRIETEKWFWIEKWLIERLHCEMLRSNDNSIGLFDGAKWQRGIKIVCCHNEKAFNFVNNFILNSDSRWTGAKLDVFPMSNIVRQICKVFIPPPILSTNLVLSLIKQQNPSIFTEDWEVLGERERNCGIDIWLSVSEQSYQDLSRAGGELSYGINRIFLNRVV